MRYLDRNNWQWLIVTRMWRFYDLYWWTTLKTANVSWSNLINPIGKQVIETLEEKWLSYIVAWYNAEHIAIYNHWVKIITCKWKRTYCSWLYWIKSITHQKLIELDTASLKYPYFTVFSRADMMDLISVTKEWWYIMEKDIVKNPTNYNNKLKSKLTDKEKTLLKQTILYAKRIYSLSTNMNATPEDMKELERYDGIDYTKCDLVAIWLKKGNPEIIRKLKELVIWKKHYKEVINSFMS